MFLRAAVILFLTCLGTPVAGEDKDVCSSNTNLLLGHGASSCGRYLNGRDRAVVDGWILGYISGANRYAPNFGRIGIDTDADGLLRAIQNECNRNPEQKLSDAVNRHIQSKIASCP